MGTCLDATVRDGAKAVELATKACEVADWKDFAVLDTLAAACRRRAILPGPSNGKRKSLNWCPTCRKMPPGSGSRFIQAETVS